MIVAFIFAIAFAAYCAVDDLADIGHGEVINHKWQWLVRAGIVVAFLVLWIIFGEATWPRVALTGLAMAPLFSLVFRITLNKLRGKDWRYVSPSNWYDWQFLSLTRTPSYHGAAEHYMRANRAGLLATVTELVAFAGCALTAWLAFPG